MNDKYILKFSEIKYYLQTGYTNYIDLKISDNPFTDTSYVGHSKCD